MEVVIVLAVLAVVAAVAAPRFFELRGFEERFLFEEVRAALGHARTLAVASGCEVQMQIGAGGYELRQRSACAAGAFDQAVIDPRRGTAPYTGAAPSGVALSSTVAPVIFDALGRTRTSGGVVADVIVTVGARQLRTAGETGLVYVP
jgi:MSHA pilin protein MshC